MMIKVSMFNVDFSWPVTRLDFSVWIVKSSVYLY